MAHNDGTSRTSELGVGAAAFYARGEQAWQDYIRTGVAATAEEVFGRLDALIAAHREKVLRNQSSDET